MSLKKSADKNSSILATDLDGTLIPLDGNPDNEKDLTHLKQELNQQNFQIVFVTGRHLESVKNAIAEFNLPTPDWIVCDVGTSIYQKSGNEFQLNQDYFNYLEKMLNRFPVSKIHEVMDKFEEIEFQEQEKQGDYKISFYAKAHSIDNVAANIENQLQTLNAPYSVIHSVDPFNGTGLIDLLPQNVSKAHALKWWLKHLEYSSSSVVFAGDSGNDLAAMTAGYKTIVVGNSPASLKKDVKEFHEKSGWKDRLYLAEKSATSGLLEGCNWFNLIDKV